MSKVIFNIVDSTFSHHKKETNTDSTVAGRDSECIIWDRTLSNKNIPTFYTHEKMFSSNKSSDNYGLIFESQSIIPHIYNQVENVLNNFQIVFTHSSDLINKYSNCKWIPGGGVWIGGKYGQGEIKIHKKNKLCSIVSSNKKMCELHELRLDIANRYSDNSNIDCFGFKNGWKPIFESLHNFMFSIVVENFVDDLYFTEKILNCFATGTIPIYLGAKKIGDKFNSDGIITFNTFEDLEKIIPVLNLDLYLSKLSAVEENFLLVQKYKCIEDYIFENYFLSNYEI